MHEAVLAEAEIHLRHAPVDSESEEQSEEAVRGLATGKRRSYLRYAKPRPQEPPKRVLTWAESMSGDVDESAVPPDVLQEAEEVFHRVSGKDFMVSKLELVEAMNGDVKIFESIDADKSGKISIEEWYNWILVSHAAKGEAGPAWLRSLIDRITAKLNADALGVAPRVSGVRL